MTMCCPLCGGPVKEDNLVGLHLVGHQKKILELVTKAGSAGCATQRLADFLWADDPGGGPTDTGSVIKKSVHFLNQKLRPRGLQVRAKRGAKSDGYRLLPYSLRA
jgi:hypothetical protein